MGMIVADILSAAPVASLDDVRSKADLCGVQIRRLVKAVREDFGSNVKLRWIRLGGIRRRADIRAAARARKARRGWR